VFALKLNRGEFAKKLTDMIRRKFSIDAGAANEPTVSTISKPYPPVSGNPLFTICVDWGPSRSPKVPRDAVFGRELAGLSVHLMSL
jgi:hypothetical protein